ncbi:ABC transporter ATP-binding protein [Brevibacillus sp. SYP-B805]|uniref:ABC transporter ATP-binding protein n=1 Tax=Brevibacillus sp. SYP-B805 TaxID=1578199 RepID=UPI0013EBA905|nr:ABC transporter ATP-binding protein [Brevibacillus sp. SYP-B805]NGQ93899.1 ABC transporter ATP-binding protein [Brevibacillus sp. SYP-B805]
MREPVIVLEELTKQYGDHVAVDHLSLTIPRGEIFGLLGPNGAGKSTTILMMLGLTEPTSGSVHVCGHNSTREAIEVKRKVGYLPDDVGFYDDLTGLENLLFTARLNGLSREEGTARAQALLARVGLEEHAGKKAGTYSRGMRQRLGLADVLIKEPEVIILDEPTLGIDPEGVREFLKLIRQLSKEEGLTVLLSSHHLHQVQQICDRVGLFVAGRLLAVGDVPGLSRQLFGQEAVLIETRVSPCSDSFLESLAAMDGVTGVDKTANTLKIHARRDVSADIARLAVSAGESLHYLAQQEYGLDEIYHRYFEGGM